MSISEPANDLRVGEGINSWPPDAETVRCPFGYFANIRERAPVYRFPERSKEGVYTYLVTGFEECASVLMRPKVFVNDLSGVRPSFQRNLEPLPLPDVPTFYDQRNIFFSNGADHGVKRSWAVKLVERDKLDKYRPLIEEEIEGLIDSFANDGRCDFRAQFSDPMPLHVVRRIMGLPDSTDPMIKRLSNAIAEMDNNPRATEAQFAEVENASSAMLQLCAAQVQNRHEHPIDDYISEIVQMQVARDGALDPNVLAKQLTIMIFGADHAMGGHLADLMGRLGRHPDLQERLRADRKLIWQFIVETLRTEAPVPWLFRACVEDTDVGDVQIPARSIVLVATIAGNYDPKEFPDPGSFNIDRPNVARNHLSMGRGVHRCVGSPLARLQAEITIERMLHRLLDIRLDPERSDLSPVWSLGFRVPTAVHLTFTANR